MSRSRRRAILTSAAFVVGIVVIFLVVAGLSAYQSLKHARTLLDEAHATITTSIGNESNLVTPTGRAQALAGVAQVSAEVTQAEQDLHSSFGLTVFGVLPYLHTQRRGLLQLVDHVGASAKTGGVLLRQVDALVSTSSGTDIALPKLRQLQTTVAAAHHEFASFNQSSTGLWGPLGSAQRQFDSEDTKITKLLANANRVIGYALPFLGSNGRRTYLVAGENNAEMRDQGAVLSYSLVHTLNGGITESPGGSVGDIELSSPVPGISIPAGTQAVFGELDPSETWQSTNATADFSFSGRDMQYMFAYAADTDVNGVIGIDVVALQALLELTGPVTVPGVAEPITAQNASNVLLNQLYQGLLPGSSQAPRHEELAAVASAVFHQLRVGNIDVVALARTLATEIAGRHLQLWDANPRYEQTISELGASGDIDTDDPARTFHVAVENATATKLDYFVDVAISDKVTISPSGGATVDTSVKLTNHAPAGQPPSFQLGPDGTNSHVSGEYVGRVFLWGPHDATQKGSVRESGLLLAPEIDLPVPPGQSATAHFKTVIPNAIRDDKLQLVFQPQPRLAPESLKVRLIASGTQASTSASLTKTTTLTWKFEH
jgi:hypothetical protein